MPLIDLDLSHPVGHHGWLDIISPLQPFLPSCPTAQALAEKKKRNRTFIDPVSEVRYLFDGCYSKKTGFTSFVGFTNLTTASQYFAENQKIPAYNLWSQVPQLEEWFEKNSHPCHAVVASYTDSLNSQPYRYCAMPSISQGF